jgi:hypothetical protein
MRHNHSPMYRQVADPETPQAQADVPNQFRRERVPALIDALDCLLALWVAEATLDAGPLQDEHSERSLNAGTAPSAFRP